MVDLLECCEDALTGKVEEDTVFPLLVLADQFNTHRYEIYNCNIYIIIIYNI